MTRFLLITALLVVAALNGLFAPTLVIPLSAIRLVFSETAIASPEAALWGSSLLWALFTLMVAGIPAALYERLVRAEGSTALSLAIWLAGAVLLSLPALTRAAEAWAQLPI